MILASELFAFHSERMCELMVEDAQTVSFQSIRCGGVLRVDGMEGSCCSKPLGSLADYHRTRLKASGDLIQVPRGL